MISVKIGRKYIIKRYILCLFLLVLLNFLLLYNFKDYIYIDYKYLSENKYLILFLLFLGLFILYKIYEIIFLKKNIKYYIDFGLIRKTWDYGSMEIKRDNIHELKQLVSGIKIREYDKVIFIPRGIDRYTEILGALGLKKE